MKKQPVREQRAKDGRVTSQRDKSHKTYAMRKAWKQRTCSLMKKSDEIRNMFQARVAVLIEREGVLYAYLSHDDFLTSLPGTLRDQNKRTPEDYITVAQQKRVRSETPGDSEREEAVEAPEESEQSIAEFNEEGGMHGLARSVPPLSSGRSSMRSPQKRMKTSYFDSSFKASRE